METLYKDINQIITMQGVLKKDGRNLLASDLSIIENAAIAFDETEIIWVGKTKNIPTAFKNFKTTSLSQQVLLPEIVDAHTHLVFGGDRAFEYSLRLNGADYQKIAENGGGILNTVIGSRGLTQQALFDIAVKRIETICSYGIGTIEIKSGYGLNYQYEKILTQVIHNLKQHFAPKIQIKNTFMAAHALPSEFKNTSDYIREIVLPLMDELHPIIDAVDIFHEQGYFTSEDVKILFNHAKTYQLPIKIHADEFNDNQGALLACNDHALSADHLLKISSAGITALSQSNTVATLLPGTGLFLGKESAPARKLLDAGVKVAMASDYNPGSSHCDNLMLLASIAAPMYKMNICEVWAAITFNAASALGLINQGVIMQGMRPRFSIFSAPSIDYIAYNWGKNLFFGR